MASFGDQIAQFKQKALSNANKVVQDVSMNLLTSVVLKSPVGSPELWAINSLSVKYNNEVSEHNPALRSDPTNLTKNGRLKPGRKLNDGMDIVGYVGGRFRGNWQVTFNEAATAQLDTIDPSGSETIQKGAITINLFDGSQQSIFLTNTLPYAIPIEYGHSTQAPAGVVRITVAEFMGMVNLAVTGLPK